MWHYIYYIAMKWINIGIRGILLKTVCVVLTLLFGASVINAGIFTDLGCGSNCCCQTQPTAMHHTQGKQIRSSTGCCSASSKIPCDLNSGDSAQLPLYSLASVGIGLWKEVGPTGNLAASRINIHYNKRKCNLQVSREKFQSPPLYLQKLSFLIWSSLLPPPCLARSSNRWHRGSFGKCSSGLGWTFP